MTTFPPSFLEEIRNRLSLSGLVGARIRMVRAGREFKGCCPFHHEKTPSFYVNDDKQFFHCFGCGAHGDVIGFIMRYEHLSFPEAVENLALQAGMQVPRDTPIEREKFDLEKRLHQLLEDATAWFEEQLFSFSGREALAYLRGRGLGDEALRRFRLGYAPSDGRALLTGMKEKGFSPEDLATVGLAKKAEDRNEHYSFFRNRVIFPVGDRRGRTVAFGARILGEGEPKYLNSPDHALFHKGQLLYGLSRARTALLQGQPIVVVEGYMDVIALVEEGYSGAVAPLGTALTEEQIQILWRLLPSSENREVSRDYSPILCFDGDAAGLRAASRAVDRALPFLTADRTLRIATMMGAKDPDELIRKSGKGAFDGILKQAVPMIDVLWSVALSGRQLRTPEERGAFSGALKRYVGQIKDEDLRKLYDEEFKRRINDVFGWAPRAGTFRKGDKREGTTASPPYIGARSLPQAGPRARERILLALILNHPELFDDVGENFALMEMQTSEFAKLRDKIVEHLSQVHDLPPKAADLRRGLEDSEGAFAYQETGRILDEVLSSSSYIGAARAAHPGAPLNQAREAWQAIWAAIEQEKVKAEYQKACGEYRQNETEENKTRRQALKERLLSGSVSTETGSG